MSFELRIGGWIKKGTTTDFIHNNNDNHNEELFTNLLKHATEDSIHLLAVLCFFCIKIKSQKLECMFSYYGYLIFKLPTILFTGHITAL